MDLQTFLELQRRRVSRDTKLEREVQEHRWKHAPKRLGAEEQRTLHEYNYYNPHRCSIKAAYARNRILYL